MPNANRRAVSHSGGKGWKVTKPGDNPLRPALTNIALPHYVWDASLASW